MAGKDLRAFGQMLRQLRKTAGFYQEELAEQLNLIHTRFDPKSDLRIDGNRISKWERAFTDKSGRVWQPKRQHMLYLIETFAAQLTPETAQTWASQAGYALSRPELQPFFPDQVIASAPLPGSFPLQTNLTPLALLPDQRLFGIEPKQQQLGRALEQSAAPWLVAIDGIGGIGKTALAMAVVREIMAAERFDEAIWISAKQEEFRPGDGLHPTHRPALDVDTFVDTLLEYFGHSAALSRPAQEKLLTLTDLLKQRPYLIVVDNLETMADYQILLPLLRRLANPGKFLLTSRQSLRQYPDVFCLQVNELNRSDVAALLRYEAEVRGATGLAGATQAQLDHIYSVAGGNPLALKLIVGQTRVLPLSRVLDNLEQAQGKKTEDLYTYIYWQAWQALTEAGRAVLLVMPLAQGGALSQLAALSELEPAALNQALEQLAAMSLIEVSGDIEQRRYRIHRLTETFLLNEVIKWQSLP